MGKTKKIQYMSIELNKIRKLSRGILTLSAITIIVFLTWYFTVSKSTLFVLNLIRFENEPSDSLICVIDLIVTFIVEAVGISIAYYLFPRHEKAITLLFISVFLLWLLITRYPNGDEWPLWYTPVLAVEHLIIPLIVRMGFKRYSSSFNSKL